VNSSGGWRDWNTAKILGMASVKRATSNSTFFSKEKSCLFANNVGVKLQTRMWSGEAWRL